MKYEDNREYGLATKAIQAPSLYQVVVHNDDFTPMEFVVSILEGFFHMSRRKATDTMLEAHLRGRAACGVYTKDVAASKIAEVMACATAHEHPFVCSMEAV